MTLAKRILTIGALFCSGAAYAGTPGWTISESSGSVVVSRPGYSAAATRGGAVKAGDIIATGKNGRAVLVRGEEYLVVSPGARITIADPKAGGMTQIIQSFGNTLYKIKKMATPHFAVETPYLAAVVKGTTFSVTVTPKGASVQVTEGRVEVATPDGGASYLVTPGEIGIVSRDAPYRLKIEGKDARTIDSPNRAIAPAPAEIEVQAIESASSLDASISEGVSEGSVQLAALSGGMISGDSAISIATASTRVAAIAAPAAIIADAPSVSPGAPAPVPADALTPLPPVADTVPAVTGNTPIGVGVVVDTGPGNGSALPLTPVVADVVAAAPPLTPPVAVSLPAVSGNTPIGVGVVVDTSIGAGPPTPLIPVVADIADAIPPVTAPVAPSAPENGIATGGAGSPALGNGLTVHNGTGNNGAGLGNGGGDGSNVGGNGNGNNGAGLGNGGGDGSNAGGNGGRNGVGDDDRDNDQMRGKPSDDDDDSKGHKGRRGGNRGGND